MKNKLRYGLLVIGSRDNSNSAPIINSFTTIDNSDIDWSSELQCEEKLHRRVQKKISGNITECRFDAKWYEIPTLLWNDFNTIQYINGKFRFGHFYNIDDPSTLPDLFWDDVQLIIETKQVSKEEAINIVIDDHYKNSLMADGC